MQTTHVLILLVPTVFICTVCARSLPDYASQHRQKRQYADIQMGERKAKLGIGSLIPHACKDFACGMVNVHASGKKKRSDDFLDAEEYDEIRKLQLLQSVLDTLSNDTS